MSDFSQVLDNPGLLKLELMMRGMRVPEEVRRRLPGEQFGVTGHALFGSAGDLDLVLPGGTWVSVPMMNGLMASTPYTLHAESDGFAMGVDGGDVRVRVEVRPRSRFFQHRTSSGLSFGRIGTVHGPYLALSPTNRCTFLHDDGRCRFCGIGQAGLATHDAVPVDDILEAIRIARGEHHVGIVYLSVGHLATLDGGVRFLEPYVAAIKKHFDILVAVDALPPYQDTWIDRTYAMGVDAVSYNLELFDPQRFEVVCPGPAREIGRERFLDALGYAATVFPSGGVACHLIVGLEPVASTHEGIDALTGMGVLPVLPMYRPFKGRDMRGDADVQLYPPTLEELVELHAHLYEAVRENRLNPNLVRDIAIVTTPMDARFFSRDDGFWGALQHKVTGSRLGRRTSAVLSDLRRALRVRRVEEAPEP